MYALRLTWCTATPPTRAAYFPRALPLLARVLRAILGRMAIGIEFRLAYRVDTTAPPGLRKNFALGLYVDPATNLPRFVTIITRRLALKKMVEVGIVKIGREKNRV